MWTQQSKGHVLQHTLVFYMSCQQGGWKLQLTFNRSRSTEEVCFHSGGEADVQAVPTVHLSVRLKAQMALEENQLIYF